MIKYLTIILFFGLSSTFHAQEVQEQDSLQAPALLQKKKPVKKKGGLMSFDSGPAKEINPLAPARAAFLSAVLPGLGQFYNKKYWKVPMVYAAIGGSAYVFKVNDNLYRRYRDAFKSRRAGFMTMNFTTLMKVVLFLEAQICLTRPYKMDKKGTKKTGTYTWW